MRNYASKFSIAVAAVCALFILSAESQAQRRGRPYYGRNDVNEIIRRVENRSDQFVRVFDNALDRSRMDGRRREDRLNERARDLETALDDLRREFDRRERYVDTRSEVSRVLGIAEGINRVMRQRRMGGAAERQWNLLRSELNALARIYNLRMLY